jgi:hypothetical protein
MTDDPRLTYLANGYVPRRQRNSFPTFTAFAASAVSAFTLAVVLLGFPV